MHFCVHRHDNWVKKYERRAPEVTSGHRYNERTEIASRGVQVLANSQIFANLYLKFANLI